MCLQKTYRTGHSSTSFRHDLETYRDFVIKDITSINDKNFKFFQPV